MRKKEYVFFKQLWGFAVNPTRKNAVLINLNCETDFVAKSEDFKLFLGNTLKLLVGQGFGLSLRKGDADLEGFLKDTQYSATDSLEQATKLLIAKTKEKVEFTQVRGLRGSRGSAVRDRQVIGGYVHKQLQQSVGSSGACGRC